MLSKQQKDERTFSRRQALLGLAGLSVTTALSGCGGAGGGSATTAQGVATLTITWPDRSRLIPDASESIKVTFLSGTTVAASQVVARPSTGSTSTLTFSSLPEGELTMTASAYPTTDGTGTAQATASKSVSITANENTEVSITMASTISSLSITPTAPSVVVGSTLQLAMSALNSSGSVVLVSSSNVTWTSLDTSTATVSSTGLVTGLVAGTVQIQVTESESGKSTTISVTVSSATTSCHLIPSETDGPYPLYTVLANSAMIRSSIQETKTGVPLTVELTLVNVNGSCAVIPNAYVYIWHCDRAGEYSGYSSSQNGSHAGETFCRGIQRTDSSGKVTFTTIYPGWYAGRITHVHFQVYLSTLSQSAVTVTSQFGFPQDITYAVYDSSLYSSHGQNTSVTSFAADNIFSDGTQYQIVSISGSVEAGYTAKLIVGVSV